MKKIISGILAIALISTIAGIPVFAEKKEETGESIVTPQDVGAVFVRNLFQQMLQGGTGSSIHWGRFNGDWYGGNGFYVATLDYGDGTASGGYNGTATSARWDHYYASYGNHTGYLTIASGSSCNTHGSNTLAY